MVPSRSADGAATPTHEPLFEAARALAPIVEGEARAAERARTLTPKTVDAMRDARLLRAFLPRELGGLEAPLPVLVELVAEVARQDGSTGWCFGMNGVITAICAAHLPDEGIERVYGSAAGGPDASRVLVAGGFPPVGRAVRESEGYRVSGHFRFGSGMPHADHACCTCIELDGETPRMDGAMPLMRTFVVPRDAVRVDDNWDVAGLEGTGSVDYHLDDVWLPDALTFVSSHPEPRRGRGLYALPLLSVASAPHAGFALGVGRRTIQEITNHAGWRQRLASRAPLAERPAFQLGYGRARARLEAAGALVARAAQALHEAVAAGEETLPARADFAGSTIFAYESALEAAQMAFRAAGAAALGREGTLQRCLRDIQAGCQHIVPSEESWERVARIWLGGEDPGMI